MSIPIMLRWLISKGRSQLGKLKEAAMAAEKERLEKALLLKEMQQRQAKMQATILPTKSRPPPQPPHPPPLPPPPSYPHQHHTSPHMPKGQTSNNGQAPHLMPHMLDETRNILPGLDEFRTMPDSNAHHVNNERTLLSPEAEKAFASSLSSSLDEEKGTSSSQSDINDNPMLSRLLDDNMSVATNIIPMNCKPNPPQTTTKRQRKRKSQSEFSGPILKQRISDNTNDSVDRLSNMGCSMDMDVGGVMDPTFNQAMPMGMPSMPSPHGHPAHHAMLNHSAVRSQTPGHVIDLTEDNVVGESSLKKLVDSVDKQFTRKDMKTEPDLSMLLYENDASMGRIPNTVQNSPSGSKNENASTSLEGFLKGSGEVGRANNYDPVDAGNIPTSCSFSKLSSLLLAPSEGPQVIVGKHQPINTTFHPDKVRNAGEGKSTPVNHTVVQDVKPQIRPPSVNVLQKSPNVDFPNPPDIKPNVPSIIDKLEASKQQQLTNIKSEPLEHESGVPLEGRVSLKFTLKQQNNVKTLTKQCNSFDESDLHLSKLDSTGTFDFKSDEDDDDNTIMPRYVYSSSPTRLQISTNKQKRPSESNMGIKVEKNKKKDKSSTNSTKRKREKEESRREKKRKKNEHIVSESVYRTVENEEKSEIPKLKIRVAKKPVSDKNDKSEFTDFTEQSYEISKKLSESPRECKVFPNQQSESLADSKGLSCKQVAEDAPVPVIDLVKEKDSGSNSPIAIQKSSSVQKSQKSGGSKGSSNTVNSKTDPKLVTKATIRLKPLTMLNSGTTISISQSVPKSAGATTAGSMKMDRRNYPSTSLSTEKRTAGQNSSLERRSSSGIHDRRNSSVSSSTTTSVNSAVTTTAKISLSSILPNAPTVSKIASLPRIPKLSSSSNASINRTSSLDPASGTNPSPAGSKSNNSYTAGRHNAVSPSGPGPGGGRGGFGNSSPSFNYNNRMAPPGAWNSRPILPFNPNRSGGTPHRQASPLGNNCIRPSGHRQVGPHSNVNSNTQMGGKSAKANSSNNPILKMNNGSSNFNFNTNATQKPFASGAKMNNNINPHAKMSNVNSAGANLKTSQASGNVANVHRYSGSHTHSTANSVRSQSSVTKSPNTTGINQSPNACHSPNITGSNRSPSLNSAGKSPNLSGSGKSPNLNKSPSLTSSPTINRSPNINNTNRSPNVQSASNRSSSNVSSRKSPLTVPIKNVSGASKNSPVLKTPPTSNLSILLTSSQKPSNSQTSKPSILKNAIKPHVEMTSVSSSNSQQSATNNPIHANKVSVSISGNTSKRQHNISVTSVHSSHQSSTQSSTTLISTVVQSSPVQVVSSNTNSVTSFSSGSKTATPDGLKKSESSNSSSSSASVPGSVHDTSVSNASSISSSVDNKNKGSTMPAARGRKNSLSAIVDKLKHNAAGGGLDLIFPHKPLSSTGQSSDKEVQSPQLEDSMSSAASEKSKTTSESSHLKSQSHHSVTKSIPHGNDPSNNTGSSSKDKYSVEYPDVTAQKSKDAEKHSAYNTCKTDKVTSVIMKEDRLKNDAVEDSKSSSENVKSMSQPLTISSPSVVSPCSNPFPLHQSPLARSTPSSPSVVQPKSNGESLSSSQGKDRLFKVPSVKEMEERISSPDLAKSADPNKWCDKSSDSQQQTSPFPVSNTSIKSFPHSDKKLSKSVESPLSDISSPDNDLVIADDESPKSTGKLLSSKGSHLNVNKNTCSSPIPKSSNTKLDTKGEISRNTTPIPTDKLPPSSPLVNMEGVATSPQTSSRPPSALSSKSPAYVRNQSGASTPKGSESPFEIDDDLMDVALGCDS